MVKSERNPQCDETVILRVLLWRLKGSLSNGVGRRKF